GVDKSISDLIEEMEMPDNWIPELAAYCAKRGIVFLSTPFDEHAIDLLDPYVPAFKIASYELTHIPMIRHAAGKKKPLIVSTGASLIEKHHTLSRRLPGPDHSFALEPGELREMVDGIRAVERVLGSGVKRLLEVEHELVNYRRAVYTARAVAAGHVLGRHDLV